MPTTYYEVKVTPVGAVGALILGVLGAILGACGGAEEDMPTTYYVKVVHVDKFGNRSLPSSQVSGQALFATENASCIASLGTKVTGYNSGSASYPWVPFDTEAVERPTGSLTTGSNYTAYVTPVAGVYRVSLTLTLTAAAARTGYIAVTGATSADVYSSYSIGAGTTTLTVSGTMQAGAAVDIQPVLYVDANSVDIETSGTLFCVDLVSQG